MARLKQKLELLEAEKEIILKWFENNPDVMITIDDMTELFKTALAELINDKDVKSLPFGIYPSGCITSKDGKENS